MFDHLHTAWRTLVPEPGQRTPLTWATFHYTVINLIPLIYMGYLVRRPGTHLQRLLVLPIVVAMTLRASFGYVWTDPRLNVYNWAEALWGFAVIGKAIEFAFARNGRWKVGEKHLGEMHTPAIVQRADLDASHDSSAAKRPGAGTFPLWLVDSTEVLCAFRGLGWDFGKDVYVPHETRSLEKGAFLRATFFTFLKAFLVLDFLDSTLKLVPRVGTPDGASIFFQDLPPVQRYAFSTFIHFCTGSALLAGFYMIYNLFTLIGVALLNHAPSAWPPIMDSPFSSDSLTIFWAKRWHQVFRQTFFVFGGYPAEFFFGRIGLILGTFTASGLYHELSMYAMGRGLDWHVPVFFFMMGILILGERMFRIVTGKRVKGWAGMTWTYFCIVILGQPCVDAWHRRGLAGGMVIPPFLSPFRLWIFPLLRTLFTTFFSSLTATNSNPASTTLPASDVLAFLGTYADRLGLGLLVEWALSSSMSSQLSSTS